MILNKRAGLSVSSSFFAISGVRFYKIDNTGEGWIRIFSLAQIWKPRFLGFGPFFGVLLSEFNYYVVGLQVFKYSWVCRVRFLAGLSVLVFLVEHQLLQAVHFVA